MADTTDDTTTNEPSPGDLRKQLEEANKARAEQAAKLAAFEQDEQLREAGLGHLSKRQRRTILRDLTDEGTEFTADNAKEIAKEYGWPTETPSPTPTPTPTSDNGSGQGDGQQEPFVVSESGDLAEDALSALALMAKARGQSASTQVAGDFEQKMKAIAAKHTGRGSSQAAREELRDLIRTEGPRHGIIHEWDVP